MVIKRETIAVIVGYTIVAAMLVAIGAFLYFAGHRAGRGSACFDVAVATRDAEGRTLRTLLLSRPGARSDYTFWGTHCSISIGYDGATGLEGGVWVYFPERAALYAHDDDALRLFPASGRWPR